MYKAVVLADSIPVLGFPSVRLVTMEVTFPRFILAEFNTHRVFSRNSASSRAIPIVRRIAQVRENPFVPEAFGQNKPGMQAGDVLDRLEAEHARLSWLTARDNAVESAERLAEMGVHKQHANRLLEPFAWHTVVVTSTEWANFMALRTHKDAQPEMQTIAKLMSEALRASKPRELGAGQWHLPYVSSEDEIRYDLQDRCAVSVVRCAAVSFERQYAERELAQVRSRHADMCNRGHWSPFEHQATPALDAPASNLRAPWKQYRKLYASEAVFAGE